MNSFKLTLLMRENMSASRTTFCESPCIIQETTSKFGCFRLKKKSKNVSSGAKRSVCVRLAETPVCLWRECAHWAAPTAASAPVRLPPTLFSPALQSHHAREPTGSSLHPSVTKKKKLLNRKTLKTLLSSGCLNLLYVCLSLPSCSACLRMMVTRAAVTQWKAPPHPTRRLPLAATVPIVTLTTVTTTTTRLWLP